jgi:anthranilate phosphoribosyltransferase
MAEHLFAQFVRILGKGKTGSRALTFDEARQAMGMILRDEVEDVQLGAFLMLLRVKEESPEELAGFVSAVREHINAPALSVDLDWASYAGKRRQQPWYLLAALTLAKAGYRVLMHGAAGHTEGRVYSEQTLAALGHAPCASWTEAEIALAQSHFAFVPLRTFCSPLQHIIDLKSLFGLRSPVNTLTRLINPCAATYSLQSIFHPAYADSHQAAAQRLGQLNAAVFKGEAGEAERRPEADLRLHLIQDGQASVEEWPRLVSGRQEKLEQLPFAAIQAVWLGDTNNEYGELAVIGTIAIALRLLGKANCAESAFLQASTLWQKRH